MTNLINVYPFVKNPCDFTEIENSKIVIAVKEAEKGNLKLLKEMYSDGFVFGHEYLVKGSYKLMGWFFNLSPYCKKYLVKKKHYGWIEYEAPNKTCLYKMIGRHNVIEIIEK